MRIRSRISSRDMYFPTSQQDVTKGTELMRRLYTLRAVQRRRMVTGRLPFMYFVSVYLFRHSILSFFLSFLFLQAFHSFFPIFFLPSKFSPLPPTFNVNSLLHFIPSFYPLLTHFSYFQISDIFSDTPQTSPKLN